MLINEKTKLLGFNGVDLSKKPNYISFRKISDVELSITIRRNYKNRNKAYNVQEKFILTQCSVCDTKYWRAKRIRQERLPRWLHGKLVSPYNVMHACNQDCKNIVSGIQRKKYTFENPTKDAHGYPYFSIGNGKYKKCHTHVVEQDINREINGKVEMIHHIDMIRTNYNLENLWLCDKTTHAGIHEGFNRLCKPLMDDGIIGFSPKTGYYLIKKEK